MLGTLPGSTLVWYNNRMILLIKTDNGATWAEESARWVVDSDRDDEIRENIVRFFEDHPDGIIRFG